MIYTIHQDQVLQGAPVYLTNSLWSDSIFYILMGWNNKMDDFPLKTQASSLKKNEFKKVSHKESSITAKLVQYNLNIKISFQVYIWISFNK